jgi:5-methylcytosine-specific restriction protein B
MAVTDEQDRSQPPAAWVIRAGRKGEFAESFFESGIAAVDFGQLPDLSGISSRDALAELVAGELPDESRQRIAIRAAQLWALRSSVRRGDLVVMPHRAGSHLALGTVTREYWYRHDSDNMRHTVSVDWKCTDLPRTVVGEDLLKPLSYRGTINAVRSKDQARRFQQLLETGRDPGPQAERDGQDSDLADLVERFRGETGYPTDAHMEQQRLRAEWAEKLAPDNIADLSPLDLTAVASHGTWFAGTYVYPHAQGVMKWIRALDGDEYARMLDHIRYLCWSDDEPWRRYGRLTDAQSNRKTTGLGHSTTSLLLAITHPQDFLAIGTQEGKWGRAAMLRRLGLPKPTGSSYGQRVMDADRRLREHLEPHFGDDTLGMGAFVRWLLDQEPPSLDGPMSLAELAKELLVDVKFLDDIVELLKDKGQVILYGPPGTGKTYLARKLAEVLAPDESCRALVQFHPSTSYEDFFEGYRPVGAGEDGGIRYELTAGPLARMAEQASEVPDQHVMIIDEINRGNLPRVLGELLFLLEYRDESVQTLYRPEEPFSLPDNLWFIGTMNTADRSIALVDAALRRRFHFVPFFPDSGPMAGLLARWLERQDEPGWIGRLVDAVNGDLTRELGGSHLLLGPSHFMKDYGSSPNEQRDRLRRIWEYNIEPFIEDQFFGDPDRIEHFRFNSIMGRHGPAAGSDDDADVDGDDPETTDGSQSDDPDAGGDAATESDYAQPEDER